MTNSISRSSTSSDGTHKEGEASSKNRKTKRPIGADSDTKRRRSSGTPLDETKDNQPSSVSPAQSPLVSENDRPEEAKASTKQRLDKVFQAVASSDVTPPDKTSETSFYELMDTSKPSSKEDSFASSSADDDSSVVLLSNCKQAELQIPKEAKGSRKSQSYRRSIDALVGQGASLSSEKSSNISDTSQASDNSSVIIVNETSPRKSTMRHSPGRRQSHSQRQVDGLGRLFPDRFDPSSDEESSVVLLESLAHRYDRLNGRDGSRGRPSTFDSSAESDDSSTDQVNGKRYSDSIARLHSPTFDNKSDAGSSVQFVKHSRARRFDTAVARRRSPTSDSKSDTESVVFVKHCPGTRINYAVARRHSNMSKCKSDSDSSVVYLKSTCHHSSASERGSSGEYIKQSSGIQDSNALTSHQYTNSDSDSEPGSSIQSIEQSPGEKHDRSVARRHSTTSESSHSGYSVEVVEQSPGGRFKNVDARHTASISNQSSSHSPVSNDVKRPAILPGNSSSRKSNHLSQRDFGDSSPTKQKRAARPAVKLSSFSEDIASPTGRNDFRGRRDSVLEAASPEGLRSACSGSNHHSMRRKRINRRLLARRPTWDPSAQHTGPAKKRKKSSANITPQIYKLDHPNPDIFLSASDPTGYRLSREQVVALAKHPTKPIEGVSDLVEHTAQMYKFDNFHQMMIVAQVTNAPTVSQ